MDVISKNSKYTIKIEHLLCGNCGACVTVCPENVLHLGADKLYANSDDCTGCSFCIITCPTDAITLFNSDEGKDE